MERADVRYQMSGNKKKRAVGVFPLFFLFLAAIPILLRDLLMHFKGFVLHQNLKFTNSFYFKQSEFLYGFVLFKTSKCYGSVDVGEQNHMPISSQMSIFRKRKNTLKAKKHRCF
ncbi:MAG: hypothetical protein C0604_02185 [Clostridiales bacterium]|nr:MAG: hypothetical protein C0604_02185 [Clostridiales bacterium]